jgi:hypothetical protein
MPRDGAIIFGYLVANLRANGSVSLCFTISSNKGVTHWGESGCHRRPSLRKYPNQLTGT